VSSAAPTSAGARQRNGYLAAQRASRPAVAVGLIGILLAAVGFGVLAGVQQDQLEQRARAEADATMAALARQLDRDVAGMVTVGVNAVDPRGRDERSWGRPLELIAAEGGLQAAAAVNLAQPLPASNLLGRLPASVRNQLDLRLSDGPDHLVITHVWPAEGNASARGYDVLLNAEAGAAARQALETGRVVSSGPTTLIQDPQGRTTIIVYVPIRGASSQVVALTTVAFHTQELFDQVAALPDGARGEWVDVASQDLLGSSHPRPLGPATASSTATVLGRELRVDVQADPVLLGGLSRSAPWVVVALGLSLTAFAGVSVAQARRGERRAWELVSDRTTALRASAASLATANRRLEAADRGKDELLAVVSHDLRSPIAVIRGFAGVLQRPEVTHEDVLGGLRRIEVQAARLSALVDDLLTDARLHQDGAGGDPELLDLRTLVTDVTADLGVGRAVVPDGPAVVRADRFQVERIIHNLLANAAKHGAPPFEVTVREVGDSAEVRIRDHGPGIDHLHREDVFDAFTQFGDRRGGVGLGLSIASRLATANGGTLELEHPAGGGACFVLRLPRATAPDDTGPVGAAEGKSRLTGPRSAPGR